MRASSQGREIVSLSMQQQGGAGVSVINTNDAPMGDDVWLGREVQMYDVWV